MKNAVKNRSQTGLFIIMLIWLISIAAVIFLTVSNSLAAGERRLPVYRVDTPLKKIALTFNAAWGDENLDDILNILDEKKVKCSFFVVGSFAEKYPESVRKIYNAGHEIGNHSLSHTDPVTLSYKDVVSDISACNKKLEALTGKHVTLYRAPSGSYNNDTVEAAESLGMTAVQWDADSVDWKDITAERITERILSKVQNGSIVLFHVGKENSLQALPDIIDKLQSDGYSLVCVSDILLHGETYIANDGTQKQKSIVS